MSLHQSRSSLRPKLNSSFSHDQEADPDSLIKEIRQLKENFDSLKTPKLYQKIFSQYKANLKNKRIANAITDHSGSIKADFSTSLDVLKALKESSKINESLHEQSQRHDDESIDNYKESRAKHHRPISEPKYTAELAIQTTPRHDMTAEELLKLKEEYSNHKKMAKVMEEDLSKIRIENIKLDKALKTAQESLAVMGKNQNNTSSSFSLPSEFKANWELLAKDQIINVFSDFIDNPIIVTNLVQEIIMICYDQVKSIIKEMNCNLLKILNLHEKNEADIKKHLANFYQDNYSTIFKLDDDRLDKIKNHFKKNVNKIFTHTYTYEFSNFAPEADEIDTKPPTADEPNKEGEEAKNDNADIEENNEAEKNEFKVEIREEYPEQFDDMLDLDDFSRFVNSVFYLCLFMLLNDPPLRVPIENFKNRKFVYKRFKKNDFICVDGFAKENSPCLVLLPAVVRNNHPYNGIKPSVLILQEDFLTPRINKVLEECEKDEQEKLAKKLKKEAEEKMIHTERNPLTSDANISVDNKYYPQSLNTTNVGELQQNNISSSNSQSIPSDPREAVKESDKLVKETDKLQDTNLDITANKNHKLEASTKILDDSKENDETITPDVTARQVKMPKSEVILRDDIEENAHNETIPSFLTERKPRDAEAEAAAEMTPQQNSSSSRDLSRPKKYPLPTYHLESTSKGMYGEINKGPHIRPLSVRTTDQDNRSSLRDNLRNKITDIYDVLKNSGMREKDSKAVRSSFCSDIALRNSDSHQAFHLQNLEESKDYSLNSYTQRSTSVLNSHSGAGHISSSAYKNVVTEAWSSRGGSRDVPSQNKENKESRENRESRESRESRDHSYSREINKSIDRDRYKVDDLREKIRKSFQLNKSRELENSYVSKSQTHNASGLFQMRQVQADMPTKATPELNTTISSLRQSIELLKNSKAQNDKIRSKFQDSYEKLNTSLVAKNSHSQSEKFNGPLLKKEEDSGEGDTRVKKSDGIVSKIVAERMKSLEKSLNIKQTSHDKSHNYSRDETLKGDKEGGRSPQVLSHEYIKQKLSKMNLNARSMSTNRPGYMSNKNEDDNQSQVMDSFRRDESGIKGMNRIGSVSKLNRPEKRSVKEDEENEQIFRALKNIYHK